MTQELFGFDAFAPREIAARIENVGVVKARLPLMAMVMLSVLAGAFIALGAQSFVIVRSDATLGWGTAQMLGGLVFSLGLLLVIVAGAELFTGNNLLVMAWADGKIGTGELLRNWAIVCTGNLVGAVGMAVLVYLSGHLGLNGGALGRTVLAIAAAKCSLPWHELVLRGVLCNVLVCMAVWMAMAGRSVVDKAVAIVFPISAFVAAGYEHSIANMYLIPLAMLLKAGGVAAAAGVAVEAIDLAALVRNLVFVIAGNLVGGSVLVGLAYHLIYRRGAKPQS